MTRIPLTGDAKQGGRESEPLRTLLCILNEEWEHRLYAERDLDALEAVSARHSAVKTGTG